MAAKFLGNGVLFDYSDSSKGIYAKSSGSIAEVSGDQAVMQSIWVILSTAPGERVGRPEFGCAIYDYIFASQSSTTTGAVVRAVKEALGTWEPRIDVLDVDATAMSDVSAYAGSDNLNGLLIEVEYIVRATNSRYNLVYPFYLST